VTIAAATDQSSCSIQPSWKEESSTTATCAGPAVETWLISDRPMLPPSACGIPASASMPATSETVVDFPFVPVTPMIGPGQSRRTMPISVTWRGASATSGLSKGIAGLTTTKSHPEKSAGS